MLKVWFVVNAFEYSCPERGLPIVGLGRKLPEPTSKGCALRGVIIMKKWLNKVLQALAERIAAEENSATNTEFIDLLGEII